jgi:hypothetical protein
MAHHYEVVDGMEQGVASIHPEESLSQVATGGKYLQCSHLSNVTSVIRSLGLSNMELRCNLFRLDLHSESTYSGIHKCFGAKNLCMLVKATEQGQSKIVVCGRRGGAADAMTMSTMHHLSYNSTPSGINTPPTTNHCHS